MAKSQCSLSLHTGFCREASKLLRTNASALWYFRYLDPDNFVNAIATTGDLSKITREQFAILFRVADSSRRGLVSWEDFTVFQTLLKRPDADYLIAFRYFDAYVVCCVVDTGLDGY